MARNKGKFVQGVAEDPALRGHRIDEVAAAGGRDSTLGTSPARRSRNPHTGRVIIDRIGRRVQWNEPRGTVNES